ncbi:MAG: amidase, partial [Azospirillum sp.]|nr:amidase [Azospirillum sp.]
VGYSPRFKTATVDPEIARAVDDAAKLLAELGAVVEPADPVIDLAQAREAFHTLWCASLARPLKALPRAAWTHSDPGLVATTEHGLSLSAQAYLDADAYRSALTQAMLRFHRRYDLLLTPQLPITAVVAGRDVADPATQSYWIDWTPFTYPFNLTRQPAASVPIGRHSDGLPMALQFVGRPYEDRVVLRAARAFERARPWAMPPG